MSAILIFHLNQKCSDCRTLLNKGPVTSLSIIPDALVLAEKTISLTSCFMLDIKSFSDSIDFKNSIMLSL